MKTEVIIEYTETAKNFIENHTDTKNSKVIVKEAILWFKAIPHAYVNRNILKCGFLNMHYTVERIEDTYKFTILKFTSIG